MYPIFIKSNRILLQDIDKDNRLELVHSKLSTIQILDGETGKLKYKIKIKPKIEKKIKEQELEMLRSVARSDISLDRQSLIGEFILKLNIDDVNDDKKPELIYLRADGIIGAITLSGKEIWSHYLGLGDADFISKISPEVSDLRILAIKSPDTVYGIDKKGNLYSAIINTNSQLRFIRILNEKILLISREGVLTQTEIKLKGSMKKTLSIDILEQKSFLGLGNIISVDTIYHNNSKYVVLGFDKHILLLDEKLNERKRFMLPENDSLMGLFCLSPYNKILALGWMGNVFLISIPDFDIKEYKFNRSLKADIDSDGKIEEIKAITKTFQIIKENKIIFDTQGRSYITAYAIDDIDNDSDLEILVGWHSKSISVYKYSTGELIHSTKLQFTPRSILITDINNDQKKELVIIGEDTVVIGYLNPPATL